MKKLIINLIHFWDLKLYERQIRYQTMQLENENRRLREIIYDLSERQSDPGKKGLARMNADNVAWSISREMDIKDHWNTAFKP